MYFLNATNDLYLYLFIQQDIIFSGLLLFSLRNNFEFLFNALLKFFSINNYKQFYFKNRLEKNVSKLNNLLSTYREGFNTRSKELSSIMGHLLKLKVTPARPFSVTRVDYTDPF